MAIVVMTGGLLSASTARAHSGSHPYYLFPDRWYQQYGDSGSYVTWMTLSYDAQYCAGCSTNYSSKVSAAVSDWAGTDTTVAYQYYATVNAAHDVHFYIVNDDDYVWAGLDEVYDEDYGFCSSHNCTASQSRPNTWWYEWTYANEYEVLGSGAPSLPNLRQGILAHELGHGLSQAHQPIPRDLVVETSIMDYDFLDDGGYLVQDAYDVCGVNHAYYDPNWGYAGCS